MRWCGNREYATHRCEKCYKSGVSLKLQLHATSRKHPNVCCHDVRRLDDAACMRCQKAVARNTLSTPTDPTSPTSPLLLLRGKSQDAGCRDWLPLAAACLHYFTPSLKHWYPTPTEATAMCHAEHMSLSSMVLPAKSATDENQNCARLLPPVHFYKSGSCTNLRQI